MHHSEDFDSVREDLVHNAEPLFQYFSEQFELELWNHATEEGKLGGAVSTRDELPGEFFASLVSRPRGTVVRDGIDFVTGFR